MNPNDLIAVGLLYVMCIIIGVLTYHISLWWTQRNNHKREANRLRLELEEDLRNEVTKRPDLWF